MSSAGGSNATPRPARVQRRTTDEEIMQIGRQLSQLHSDIESRPTGLMAGGSSKKDRDRGIGSSKPYQGPYSSDGEGDEWESVSSESSKEDFLAYGSTVSFPQAAPRPAQAPPTVHAPPERSAFVDPRYFGPQNSLNGLVSPLPSTRPPASAPMREVQAVPLDDVRYSTPPTQVYPKVSRPTEVQLEQPIPVAPISPERLERSSYSEKHDRKVSSSKADRKTSSGGKILTGAALASAAGVIGHTILSDDKGKSVKHTRAQEERLRREAHRDAAEQDRRVTEERERDQAEEEERKKNQIDAEYEEYLQSIRRSRHKGGRTKQEDADRSNETGREQPGDPGEIGDRPRLPSGQPKSTDDYFDYRRVSDDSRAGSKAPIDPFQFQVADDAFPTPIYSRRATPEHEKDAIPPAVRDTPQVYTIEREPSFTPPRLSRKDSFEMEQMAEQARKASYDHYDREEAALIRAYEEAKKAAAAGHSSDIISASYADEKPAAPAKDPVLEEADEFYRKSRRSAAQEIRSRSTSPEPSVVGKWDEQDDESDIYVVPAPKAEDTKPPPGPYAEPNADVRIDTVFDHPEQLSRFLDDRVRSGSEDKWTRDPSAERERPLLNLVRPTPIPSPSIERRREREEKRAAKSRSRSRSQTRSREAVEDVSETAPINEVSSANVVIGPRGEIIDLAAEQKESEIPAAAAAPAATDRSLEQYEKPDKQARTVWGVVNTALADQFGRTTSADKPPAEGAAEEQSRDIGASEIDLVDDEPVKRTRGRRGSFSGERDFGSIEPRGHSAGPRQEFSPGRPVDVEPISEYERRESPSPRHVLIERDADVRPRPQSRSSSHTRREMPGSFGDDLEFAATIGAGLKAAGFDDKIASDDPQYRRRDSPPGSNDELGPTSRDLVSAVEDAPPVGDEWGTSLKGKKKKKKAKKGRQDEAKEAEPEPEPETTRVLEEERPVTPIEIVEPPEAAESFDPVERTRDVLAEPAEPVEDNFWDPPKKLSKKERKLLAKKAAEDHAGAEEPLPTAPGDVTGRDVLEESPSPLEGSRDLPAEVSEPPMLLEGFITPLEGEASLPNEDAHIPEDDLSSKKLSKKERKLLARKKAAEALSQEEGAPSIADYDTSQKPIDDPAATIDKEAFSAEKYAIPNEDIPVSEEAAALTDDTPLPEDDISTPKKLTKKEQRKLAKKMATEAQLQETDATSEALKDTLVTEETAGKPIDAPEDDSHELRTSQPSGLVAGPAEDAPPTEDSSRELETQSPRELATTPAMDATMPADEAAPPKKLSKKERRKLAEKQRAAAQPQETQASEPPKEESVELAAQADLAPEKPEDAWDISRSPPAEDITSPTADDDVWQDAVEEAPAMEAGTPREPLAVPDDELAPKEDFVVPEDSAPKDITTGQDEESFTVPSKKKKKKKKGAAAFEDAADRHVDEQPHDGPSKDEQQTTEATDEQQKTGEQLNEPESREPLPEEDMPATPTKKGKKNKKNRRKLDDIADPEPPDKGIEGHTNGHANGDHQAKSDNIGEDSFLADAGTLGEGVGVPGAAAAVIAASAALTGSHATDSPSDNAEKPSDDNRAIDLDSEIPGPGEDSQAVDPDIVPRQVKYVIDPQHGDLLSLPPSTPPSPTRSIDEDLPQLPDSRPDTPPEEAYKRELLKSRRRKSTQDSPHARSTSETSIPLPLLLGQRSNPSSPRFAKASPASSPVASATDNRKSLSRPISWDSKKDIRPLILPTRRDQGSPSRSVSPRKSQERELEPSPTIGLGLSDVKEHIARADEADVPGEGAEGAIPPAEEPAETIDPSTPTKKGKGKAIMDDPDEAYPDSDPRELASAPDVNIGQDRGLSWDDGFGGPEVPKDEASENTTSTPVELVEATEPVSKKDKRKKKKKQSLDVSVDDTQGSAGPTSEEPSATVEPEKSIEAIPPTENETAETQLGDDAEKAAEAEGAETEPAQAPEPEAIEPQPAVEAERSLEPQPEAVQDEPVMTKAEKKKAKKKKKAGLALDEPQPVAEMTQPAEEPPANTPTEPVAEPSPEPSADASVEPSAELSAETPAAAAEDQGLAVEQTTPQEDLPAAKSKKGKKKKKKSSQSALDDIAAVDPEKPLEDRPVEQEPAEIPTETSVEPTTELATDSPSAEKSADDKPAEEQAIERPEVLSVEPSAELPAPEPKAAEPSTETVVDAPVSDKTEPAMTKAEKKKAKKKKKASQSSMDDTSAPESNKPTEESPADSSVAEEPQTIAAEPERLVEDKSALEQPSETAPESSSKPAKDPNTDTHIVEESERSVVDPPPEEPALATEGNKNEKKKAAQAPDDDTLTSGPELSEQPSDDKQIEESVESATAVTEEPITESSLQEIIPGPEDKTIDSPADAEAVESSLPHQPPVLTSEPTETKDIESTEIPKDEDSALPVTGKKAKKKKKKKGSIWDGSEAATPTSEEKTSATAEESHAPKETVTMDDLTATDTKADELKSSEVEGDSDPVPPLAEPENDFKDIPGERSGREDVPTTSDTQDIDDKPGDIEATPLPAAEEAPSEPSPAPNSADDESGQQLGKKKKKKKGKKEAESAVEPIPEASTIAPPSEEAVASEIPAGHDATQEKDNQADATVPDPIPTATEAVPEEIVQAEARADDPSAAPAGKKGKKGKKKRGSVDESAVSEASPTVEQPVETTPTEDPTGQVTSTPVSEPSEQVAEPSLIAPDETSPDASKDKEDGDVRADESAAPAEESSREAPEQSAPDATTGAEESSSTVLESALSGKKSKKKKKKSVSFAELPPELTADSTVSPMPEKEDGSSDVSVETRTEKERELDRSLDEAWDGAWDSPVAEPSEPLSDPTPTSDTPAETELSLPKSKKKKKKKGKAVEDLASSSDADVSAPPTPVEEEAPSRAAFAPSLVEEPGSYPASEEKQKAAEVSAVAEAEEDNGTGEAPSEVTDRDTPSDSKDELVPGETKDAGETMPIEESLSEIAPEPQDTTVAPNELEIQSAAEAASTTEPEPTDDASSAPLTKKEKKKKKKKKGAAAAEPEPEPEPASESFNPAAGETAISEPTSEPVALAEEGPTESGHITSEAAKPTEPGVKETAEPEASQPETPQADSVEEQASTPLSKKDKKKKKKKGLATPEPEPEPVSTDADHFLTSPQTAPKPELEPEPERAQLDAGASDPVVGADTAVDVESQPAESSVDPGTSETTPDAKSEAEPSDELAVAPSTKKEKKKKKKKGKTATESESEPLPEVTPSEPTSTENLPSAAEPEHLPEPEPASLETAESVEPVAEPESQVDASGDLSSTAQTTVDPESAASAQPDVDSLPLQTEDTASVPPTAEPQPEPTSEGATEISGTTEAPQTTSEQIEGAGNSSAPALTKKEKKKRKKSKADAEQLPTLESESVVEPAVAEAEPSQPDTLVSAVEGDVEKTTEPPSHEPESDNVPDQPDVSTEIAPAAPELSETKDMADAPDAEPDTKISPAAPIEAVETKDDALRPETEAPAQDQPLTSEPADAETALQSESQAEAQPEDNLSSATSSKKAKKKKGKKKDQPVVEPEQSAEPTTSPQQEQPAEPETVVPEMPQTDDSTLTPETKSQVEEISERQPPAEAPPTADAPVSLETTPAEEPLGPDDQSSIAPLSKKEKKKKKKKGAAAVESEPEPAPEPEPVAEETQLPPTPAKVEEPIIIPEEPATPGVQGLSQGDEAEDGRSPSPPLSKKEKKKKKKAQAEAALQLESSREKEPETIPAEGGENGEQPTEGPSDSVNPEIVDSPETRDVQSSEQQDKPMDLEPTATPPVETPAEPEEPSPEAGDATSLAETSPVEVIPAAEEPLNSAEIATPGDEGALQETAQEPAASTDEIPLSKKDKKKKKKAKAKAEAEAAQDTRSETPTAATEEPPASADTKEPEADDPTPGIEDAEQQTAQTVEEPVPESEPAEPAILEESAPAPAKGKKAKKKQKKAKALEEAAQADAGPTPPADIPDDAPRTDTIPAPQEPIGELAVRSVSMNGSVADTKLQNPPRRRKQSSLKSL